MVRVISVFTLSYSSFFSLYSPAFFVFLVDSFVSALVGKTAAVRQKSPRKVLVTFKPPHAGTFHAALEITFCDATRPASDQEFTVVRGLRGRAVLSWGSGPPVSGRGQHWHHNRENDPVLIPGTRPSGDWVGPMVPPDEVEELLDCDEAGISVSHEEGLDFCVVERRRRDGPFKTSSSLLTIRRLDGFPAVILVKAGAKTSDGSDSECVILFQFCFVFIHRRARFAGCFEGDSRTINPGTECTVRVTFSPKFEGVFKATLELVFYDGQRSAWFAIHRRLQGIAGSPEDHERLASFGKEDGYGSTTPNQEAPPRTTALLFPQDQRRNSRTFPDYEVPRIVQEAVDKSSIPRPYDKSAQNLILALRPTNLSMDTYPEYFKALLNVEDGQQQLVL
jgi:hypothetical protein